MATIHPTIRAQGEQCAPCWIIFKGKGQVSQEEIDYYDTLPNIKVAFQKKVVCVFLLSGLCVIAIVHRCMGRLGLTEHTPGVGQKSFVTWSTQRPLDNISYCWMS